MHALSTFSRLMDHHQKYHLNVQHFGDSGAIDGSIQICFVCGMDLARDEKEELKRLEMKMTIKEFYKV